MKKEDGKSSDGKIKTHLLADNITWRAYYVLNPSILSEGSTEEEAIINLKYGKWIKKPVMNTLEKEFAPYDESLELKALGFDEPCFATYDEDRNFELQDFLQTYETFPSHIVAAPTLSQAFRWFREKYNLLVGPFQSLDDKTYQVRDYYFEIGKVGNLNVIVSTDNFQTYEEAELACLRKLIEIVKSNKS